MNGNSLNSRFKSLDTLKVKIISVTFRRVIRTNHKKASKIWRHENIQLGGCSHGSDKTLQVGYANHFYRSAHKFEQICRHRLRRQNVGYSNFSQPQSHLSFCVLLQYLVERRRVVTQLGKLD